MIIIIPIGGIGKRFSDEQYSNPKPLIRVNGKYIISWLIESLQLSIEDKLVITYTNNLKIYNFEDELKHLYPGLNIYFCVLETITKGAVHTLLYTINKLQDQFDISNRIVSLDCDTFY